MEVTSLDQPGSLMSRGMEGLLRIPHELAAMMIAIRSRVRTCYPRSFQELTSIETFRPMVDRRMTANVISWQGKTMEMSTSYIRLMVHENDDNNDSRARVCCIPHHVLPLCALCKPTTSSKQDFVHRTPYHSGL